MAQMVAHLGNESIPTTCFSLHPTHSIDATSWACVLHFPPKNTGCSMQTCIFLEKPTLFLLLFASNWWIGFSSQKPAVSLARCAPFGIQNLWGITTSWWFQIISKLSVKMENHPPSRGWTSRHAWNYYLNNPNIGFTPHPGWSPPGLLYL